MTAVLAALSMVAVLLFAPGAVNDASAVGCASVESQTDLNTCITDYNSAAAGTITTANVMSDFTLSADTTTINNASTATFNVVGNGHTIDGGGFMIFDQTAGTTTISNVTLTGASTYAVEIAGGTATVKDSTVSNNVDALRADGTGMLTVENSTLSFNDFDGLEVYDTATATVTQTTITDNGDHGIELGGTGTAGVAGSIVARNVDFDCNATVTNLGGNAFEDTSCSGTATSGINLDATLEQNDCTTIADPCPSTVALLAGSAAIDLAGACGLDSDERGFDRLGPCDSGAFEAFDCTSPIAVDAQATDEETEEVMRFAIGCYNNASAGSTTTINLNTDLTLSANLPNINNSTTAELVLEGMGHTIDGAATASDVLRQTGGTSMIKQLTLTGGTDEGFDIDGGTATVSGSTLTMNDDNGAEVGSGGDTLNLENSTVTDNGDDGVYVQSGGFGNITQTTITDNIDNGIRETGTATVTGSLVARNTDNDCSTTIDSGGGNAFGDNSCDGSATTGLEVTLDAGPPAQNGCTTPCTFTIALLDLSPAIDNAGVCGFTEDQRGVTRPAGECDSGAFEVEEAVPVFCDGKVVTQNMNTGGSGIGTGGDDVILGTPGNDKINGLGGDDTICGGDGDDILLGGPGIDSMLGEGGNDIIRGGGAADTLSGGPGNDKIVGQGGLDNISGGDGNDTIDGLGAADTIDGGPGNDNISGQNGADVMNGGPGIDTIKGQTGPDKLFGDGDNDTLRGGNGNDDLDGGTGTDVCAGNLGPDDRVEPGTCESQSSIEGTLPR